MADQTVTPQVFGYGQACEALRKTAQAMAILQAIWIVVEAEEDGCVTFKGDGVGRWHTSVEAAAECTRGARDVIIASVQPPENLDWCTPVNLLEVMGTALWGIQMRVDEGRLQPDQLQSMIDVATESLGRLYEALSIEADRLKLAAEITAVAETMTEGSAILGAA